MRKKNVNIENNVNGNDTTYNENTLNVTAEDSVSENNINENCDDFNNDLNIKIKEMEDKYMRLYADFENYKKWVLKEREELKNRLKVELLSSVMEVDNDMSIALKNIKDVETKRGVELIYKKIENFLKNHGIESIQTDVYDENLHEVVAILETGENKIVDVVSKGYTLNGKPIKYPKIILSK